MSAEGNVEDVEILKASNDQIAEIYRKVVESSPKWKPAVQKGKKVGVRLILPLGK